MEPALQPYLERIREAAAHGQTLRIRGAGSKDFHGYRLTGQVLDTRDLQGIVSYEPSELVVTVRAGTSVAQLEAVLQAQGQYLAFEPPLGRSTVAVDGATVGGMVAAGWSGPARASVGAVRDFVLGADLINGQGQWLRYGGQVMKNVAGYDVSRLMAGSWGTLGLITQVSLKVLPMAPAQATLCWDGVTQAWALEQLHQWGGQPLPLNASCWLPQGASGRLYVRLRGAQAAVQAACQKMGGARMEEAQAAQHWSDCCEQQLDWFAPRSPELALWRLSVPQTAPVLDLPPGVQAALVEWHGAQRWVLAPRSMGPALQALARSVGGHAVLHRAEQGVALSGQPLFAPASPALQRVHAQLRRAFDPVGVWDAQRVGPQE